MTNSKIPTECPHCGCTEAYEKSRPEGRVNIRYDLAGRAIDFSCMWGSLTTTAGKYLYCMDCGRRIGRVEDATDFKNANDILGYLS